MIDVIHFELENRFTLKMKLMPILIPTQFYDWYDKKSVYFCHDIHAEIGVFTHLTY